MVSQADTQYQKHDSFYFAGRLYWKRKSSSITTSASFFGILNLVAYHPDFGIM
jgi:hypothetical protein